jgi:hypothetical protein
MTFVILEFSRHLSIKEFQVSKHMDTVIDFWIPDMNDPAFADTSSAATRIRSELSSANTYKLWEHSSGMLNTARRMRTGTYDGETYECTLTECTSYAPKRIIIAA